MPYSWIYSLATSLALYLSTKSSDFVLILYIQWDPIGFFLMTIELDPKYNVGQQVHQR